MNAFAPDSPSDMGVAPGDIIAGKYRVDHILGQGGMGVVVSAMHIQLDERVAIKIMRPEGAGRTEACERFMREARVAVKIKSQHVARVLDVGQMPDTRPYMVMEYLEGRDLGEELERNGPMPEAQAVDYVLQACDALAEAHKRGIVHRDLKPSNLFLCKNQKPPIIKLLDFGVSKFKDNSLLPHVAPSLTAETALLGTPYYMSPEQIRSAKDVDEKADVWALGVILYELISGRLPFEGTSATGVLAAICGDKPKPLHQVCATVSADVSEIVGACLEKNLEERMPNVRELVRALAAVAPDKASTIDERLAGINIPSSTANGSRGSFPSLPDAPISVRTNKTLSRDEMLGATVGGITQTQPPAGHRSKLLAIVAGAAVVTVGVLFFVTTREPSRPANDVGISSQSARPVIPANGASMAGNTAPAPSSSAPEILVEPAPLLSATSATAPIAVTKPQGPTKSTSSPTSRPSSAPGTIQLGKEVETRR